MAEILLCTGRLMTSAFNIIATSVLGRQTTAAIGKPASVRNLLQMLLLTYKGNSSDASKCADQAITANGN